MALPRQSDLHVIVGLGLTGLSVARYLHARNIPFAVTDSRMQPPKVNELLALSPQVYHRFGQLDANLLQQAAVIVLSPGVPLHESAIQAAIAKGVPVLGDIELFAKEATAPVIAITGTNAKSTVTTLVGKMTSQAGYSSHVGGNLGLPALDLLEAPASPLTQSVYVLELSSFQLETTTQLKPAVASILNVSPDHLDRYADFKQYQQAKQRIYSGCQAAVINSDDPLTACMTYSPASHYYFSIQKQAERTFCLMPYSQEMYLAYEDQPLLALRELPILGKHYQANALAALALGYAFGLAFEPMLTVLREFKGLAHRCEWVRSYRGVHWYNDSKGTNVGATQAAIEGIGSVIEGKVILIAGGQGKQADFSLLNTSVCQYTRHVILLGEAAREIAAALKEVVPISFVNDMAEAVYLANRLAQEKDSVLLSPACASFDMFDNYEHRGKVFTELVGNL